MSGPTSGACKTRSLPDALAFFGSEPGAHQKPDRHQTRRDKQSVGAHDVTGADDDLGDQRQRAVNAREDRSGISG